MTNDSRKSRAGEAERTWFRSDRIFRLGEAWYIATREGIDVGPYGTLAEARHHCAKLIAQLARIDNEAAAAIAVREFNERPRFDLIQVEPSAELELSWR